MNISIKNLKCQNIIEMHIENLKKIILYAFHFFCKNSLSIQINFYQIYLLKLDYTNNVNNIFF